MNSLLKCSATAAQNDQHHNNIDVYAWNTESGKTLNE